jgi:hypothetical protein
MEQPVSRDGENHFGRPRDKRMEAVIATTS